MIDEDNVKTENGEDDIKTELARIYYPHGNKGEIPGEKETVRRCFWCFEALDTGKEIHCPHCGRMRRTEPEVNCHLRQGTVIRNQFIIGEVEGFGGFGVTYRAWDINLKRMVAVKEYFNNRVVSRTPGTARVVIQRGKQEQYRLEIRRFLEEARCTAQFRSCENIVYVYDIFEENDTAYMVMEALEGCTLLSLIRQEHRIPWQKTLKVVSEVSRAAEELHKKKIIHQDISPDNIFLCKDGRVKLLDLGAAVFPGCTDLGLRIVKPGFAPAEQYSEEGNTGPWSDVYALSATAYYALTGIQPRESTDRGRHDDIEKPSKLVKDIPDFIDKTVMRGMDPDIRLRFQSMEDFRNAILNKGSVIGAEELIRKRKTFRLLITAAALLVIAAGSVILWKRYISIRNKALLTDTTVYVLLPEDGDAETSGKEVYSEMSREFQEQYPNVKVEISEIPQNEYQQTVREEDNCTLFERNVQDAYLPDGMAPDEIYAALNTEEYRYLDTDRPERGVPLGYRVMIPYGNTVFSGKADAETDAVPENLVKGKLPVCIGDSGDFYDIQDALPGSYTVLSLPEEERCACYTDLWSINENATQEQKDAAMRLLEYWLGEKAQDILHIQNKNNLPLNETEFEAFSGVYGEITEQITGMESLVTEENFEKKKAALAKDGILLKQLRNQMEEK